MDVSEDFIMYVALGLWIAALFIAPLVSAIEATINGEPHSEVAEQMLYSFICAGIGFYLFIVVVGLYWLLKLFLRCMDAVFRKEAYR